MKIFFYILLFIFGILLYFDNFLNQKEIDITLKKNIKIVNNISKVKIIEKNIYEKFDLENDDSIQKFVNNEVSFQNKNYSPKNLENVRHIFIYSTKDNSATLREEAQEALKKLSIEFGANFEGNKIKVISGYRGYEEQNKIEKSGACEKNLCAKAGYSEHQTGLAVDLFLVDGNIEKNPEVKEYFSWLEKNAHNFGFINTYIKGKEIDGYKEEPWHWRYVGVELASYLKQQDMSFAEFYEKSEEFNK